MIMQYFTQVHAVLTATRAVSRSILQRLVKFLHEVCEVHAAHSEVHAVSCEVHAVFRTIFAEFLGKMVTFS
jgi:hypothetical protein